jgi:hypothetical protein
MRDGSAFWLYTRALVAFRKSGEDEQAAALVRDAWSANEHVPAILAGTKPPVMSDDGYVTMGGPDEATYYVTECGSAWRRTPGAIAWLTKLAATLTPNRRTRLCTDHAAIAGADHTGRLVERADAVRTAAILANDLSLLLDLGNHRAIAGSNRTDGAGERWLQRYTGRAAGRFCYRLVRRFQPHRRASGSDVYR